MEYKTIKEISELWGVSPAMIRKYCSQGRIPGAKRETGGWMIPSKSEKPEASSTSPIKADELHPLARKIRNQKNGRNFHGLYDYKAIAGWAQTAQPAFLRHIIYGESESTHTIFINIKTVFF